MPTADYEYTIQLSAEWINYMNAYRVFNPLRPQHTVAYVDTMKDAQRPGYRVVLCETGFMCRNPLSTRTTARVE